MASFTRDETRTTDRTAAEALAAGRETLQSLGLTVTETSPTSLQAKGGSAFMAYWMGLYLNSRSMPVTVDYSVSDNGSSRTIQVHTKSGVIFAWYKWKFKHRANDITDGLLQGLDSKLGSGSAQPVG